MKGQSDTKPNDMIMSRGKTQVNYNITSEEVTDEHGTHTVWKYDVVEVEGKVTKAKVIEAMKKADNKATEVVNPDELSAQLADTDSELKLSVLTGLTCAQLDTYIDKNVTTLAEARTYLKKLSRVVMALVKQTQ